MTEFDYNKLRGKIREYGTQEAFAAAIGISAVTLSERLNNKSLFTQKEIAAAVNVLNISTEDIPTYFFTPLVKGA